MKLTTLALYAILPLAAIASPVVCPSQNAPGGQIFALPGSTFGFCLEDLDHGDADFNDLIATGSISADGTQFTLSWLASSAAFTDPIYYGSTFLFSNGSHLVPATVSGLTPGSELVFRAQVGSNSWFTGPGSRNSSGDPQFIVWQEAGSTVPEPSTAVLCLLATGALLALRRMLL